MKIVIDVPNYDKNNGLTLKWDDDFSIEIESNCHGVIIKANEAGLISLARHFLTLSQGTVPKGHHLHLDKYNSLEDNSCELIIEKQ